MSAVCALLRLDGRAAQSEMLAPVLEGLAARGPDGAELRAEGVAALGAALKIKDRLAGKKVVLVMSGGNLDHEHLLQALA